MYSHEPFAGLNTVVESSHPFVDTDFPTPPVRYSDLIDQDYIIQRVHRFYPQLRNAGMGLISFRAEDAVLFQDQHYDLEELRLSYPKQPVFMDIVKKYRLYRVKFQDSEESRMTLEDFLQELSEKTQILQIKDDLDELNREIIRIYNDQGLTYGDLSNSETLINLLYSNLPSLKQRGIQILEASLTDSWRGFDGRILDIKGLIKERICSTYRFTLREYRLYRVKYTLTGETVEKIDTLSNIISYFGNI